MVAVLSLVIHVWIGRVFNAELQGDELRYVGQAMRLLDGVPVYPDGVVENPPLFPFVLAALLMLGVSVAGLKLASAIVTAGAAWLFFSLATRFLTARWAFVLTALFVLYPPMLHLGSQVMTEPPVTLLLLIVCRLLLDIDDVHRPGIARMVGLAASLAAIALLKPVFGYAVTAGGALAAVLWMTRAGGLAGFHRWTTGAAALSIALCIPYLAFLHSLTGSYFSWGTTGGEHLYWMSIGGEDVWGSWVAESRVNDIAFLVEEGIAEEVVAAEAMSGHDAQRYYVNLAAERVRENPAHLMRNVAANTARVLFNYPYSFRAQSLYTYAYLLPNMVVYLGLALSLLPLLVARRTRHPGLLAVIALAVIYLGGNALVGSTGRQGVVLVGPFLLWMAFQLRQALDAGWIASPARGG